jgi:hypothetical protein
MSKETVVNSSKVSGRKVPVVVLIGGVSVVLMAIVLVIAIFMNYRVVRESKRRDLMGLQYYEANLQTRDIGAAILRQSSVPDPSGISWVQAKDGSLQTSLQNDVSKALAAELPSLLSEEAGRITSGIVLVGRDLYAFKKSAQNGTVNINARLVHPSVIFNQMTTPGALVYVLDRRGRLIYSTRQISLNIAGRELVQRFIRVPMRSAQMEINQGRRNLLGAFQNIENTNLVYFVEMDLAELEGSLQLALRNQLTLAGFAVLALMMILVGPLAQFRQQLLGVARAIQGMALAPGNLRLPAFVIGSEFNRIEENLILLNQSMSVGVAPIATMSIDFNVTPQPGFVEYEMERGSSTRKCTEWFGCRLTGDGMHWVFLIFRPDDSLDATVQRSFFAGMLPAIVANRLTCDKPGKILARQMSDGILQAWNHAFGGDRKLQYCFGAVERSTGNMLVLTKEYFVSSGGGASLSADQTEEGLSGPRIVDLKQTGFAALLPWGQLREREIEHVSRVVASISAANDLPQVREQVESSANAVGLKAGALIIRVKS